MTEEQMTASRRGPLLDPTLGQLLTRLYWLEGEVIRLEAEKTQLLESAEAVANRNKQLEEERQSHSHEVDLQP